jgi:hypothetical protein
MGLVRKPSFASLTMADVFLADHLSTERLALRLFVMDLNNMEVVGEGAALPNMLTQAPILRLEMLLVD